MPTPYTFRTTFIADPGTRERCILLRVPSRGTIRSIVISQEGGSEEGFDFEIFTNRAVCPPDGSPDSSSSSSSAAGSTLAEELFSIFGRKTTAGKVFSQFEADFVYECDGGSTNKKRELYMRFTPPPGGDVGAKEFHMKLDIMQPLL